MTLGTFKRDLLFNDLAVASKEAEHEFYFVNLEDNILDSYNIKYVRAYASGYNNYVATILDIPVETLRSLADNNEILAL